ncbi:glycoside hydrolase family 81 [Paenibacillus kribbensis]|uniref:glucan endo-1,3-beta-D-glucosidase n=1 Tax=Paenibacillus kribbensis TaxID=172713 RepID=A0A222WJ98_9BACL|nr:glycosyl hydrolase [Paenibacillus kribbensis]ASR45851.1 glycoside hydrolase family 81 [Paenibacillus kribbensis]
MKKKLLCLLSASLICLAAPVSTKAFSGEVKQGAGSYSTTLPAGAATPQNEIYKTANVTGAMPTNDWWSSLAWVSHSEAQYPHPIALKNQQNGLRIFNPSGKITVNPGFVAGWMDEKNDFTIGHSAAASFPDAKVDGFSDWFVKSLFQSGSNKMSATYGHGSPYVYFEFGGGNPKLSFNEVPKVWSGSANSPVLGITINGSHYGLFGPSGSTWSGLGTNTLVNQLNGKNYFTVAALPDKTAETLDKFQQYAYSFVTNSKAQYSYNEGSSEVTTTFNVTTTAKEGTQAGTIFALYPHQWKNSSQPLLGYTYNSVRGLMKTAEGTSFQTKMKFSGVLPSLPDLGSYDKNTLNSYVNEAKAENYSGDGDTYWTGKRLGKLAALAPIADQVGNTAAATQFRNEIKSRLQDWFKASDSSGNLKGSSLFVYNNNWGTLIGYPDSFGSAIELNDHHFHYGYFIKAAAEIARVDKNWASDSQWGQMVQLLIRDIANTDRSDSKFPYLRNFDPYAGHTWASGHAKFGDGNNNESSSEAMNAWAGVILWGEATGNTKIRDLGIYLYTTEMNAINEYWFDVHGTNNPAGMGSATASMIWGGKTVGNATWWTSNPAEVHGINWLPITSASLYLTQYPEYTARNYNDLLKKSGGNFSPWEDIVFMYRAISDPSEAKDKFSARAAAMTPEAGNSKANAYHWIYNLDAIGNLDRSVTANTPIYAVFNKNGVKTYVAYNFTNQVKTVTFSDGHSITVQPNSFNTGNGSDGGNTEPDTQAPSSPANVRTASKTSSSVTLEWNAATDNVGVTGYIVYKDGAQAAEVSGTSASITGLNAATSYSFTVKARDAAGNLSAASNAVEVTTEAASGGGNDGGGETKDYTAQACFVSDSEALLQFTPKTASAYVDVHYVLSGGQQLNYRMTNNSGIWEQRVTGLNNGAVISYWFTYEKAGAQYDTPKASYTHQAAPTTTTGISKISATEALITFRPESTSAFADVHYTVSGGDQMNYHMTKNNGAWEQKVSGLSSGQVISYWFTYEKDELAHDTPKASYTHL